MHYTEYSPLFPFYVTQQYKRSNEYHLSQMRDQIIPKSNFVIKDRVDTSQDRHDDKRSGKSNCDKRHENPKFTGYFQGQANLNTGKVPGYYYNTHARVTFENPLSNQAPDDETSFVKSKSLKPLTGTTLKQPLFIIQR